MHQFIYGLLIGIFAGGALSYLYAKTVIAKAQADYAALKGDYNSLKAQVGGDAAAVVARAKAL
jgi:hypothetical protein